MMWKERVKRVGLLIVVALITLTVVKILASKKISLPTQVLDFQIKNLESKILGQAIEALPKKEPVIQTSTKEIIGILKKLPEDQLNQIKKEIFGDFCEKMMGK